LMKLKQRGEPIGGVTSAEKVEIRMGSA
jgi:hypothetical protein